MSPQKRAKPQKEAADQILSTLQDLLIVDLLKLDISSHNIRRIVRVELKRVNAISKIVRPKIESQE